MKKKKKKVKENRLAIKLFLCSVYLIIMTVLFVCSYKLYQEKKNIIPWSEVETVEEYTYIDISKMSEKFAYYKDTDIGIHFVIEQEDNGLWHTYLIAINEKDYDRYKDIIDYSYNRTDKIPNKIRVYGYPSITSNELKELAIKNIDNFLPAENEVTIKEENYETYLTNSYLDTTLQRKDHFSILLCVCLFLLFLVIVLFILTIFDKDKIVDNIDEKLETENKKIKKRKRKKV